MRSARPRVRERVRERPAPFGRVEVRGGLTIAPDGPVAVPGRGPDPIVDDAVRGGGVERLRRRGVAARQVVFREPAE